jgi:hypothetical protein
VLFLVVLSGIILLGLLLWWHRELFFSWNHGGCQCWGLRKPAGVPEHKSYETGSQARSHESRKVRRQNLRKPVHASKVVNPFTCALAPPFTGRRRDFYIPRLPSNLRNIPNENIYKNVFYISWFAGLISYIYKAATSSHFEPGLLKWSLWLGFF